VTGIQIRHPSARLFARLAGGCLILVALAVAGIILAVYLRLQNAERDARQALDKSVADMRRTLTHSSPTED
jgi:hypothetical protein